MAKPSFFLYVLLLSIVGISCSKDDDATTSIVGDWKLTHYQNAYPNGGNYQWEPVNPAANVVYQFQADNRFAYSSDGMVRSGGEYFLRQDSLYLITLGRTGNDTLAAAVSMLQKETLELAIPVRNGKIMERYRRQ